MSINAQYLNKHSDTYHLWGEPGELHIKQDPNSGLTCLIAIHNTNLGPSLGGCRFIEYESIHHAIDDATRLAKGMSYKAAAAGLNMGGGKSVILKPKNLANRDKAFEDFGAFIDTMNGRYITALDSGTNLDDMAAIARKTKHVSSKPSDGDPSPFTARGIFSGIKTAVKFKLNRDDLSGLHVAIQGLGHVGYALADYLHQAGAKLTVTDINPTQVERAADEFKATPVTTEAIFSVDCDVFSPCALGAIINDVTLPQLKASIVAGAANNQLAETKHGEALSQRGILYAPDYVINAGGLIHCVSCYYDWNVAEQDKKIDEIPQTLATIFERAHRNQTSTAAEADRLAEERIYG